MELWEKLKLRSYSSSRVSLWVHLSNRIGMVSKGNMGLSVSKVPKQRHRNCKILTIRIPETAAVFFQSLVLVLHIGADPRNSHYLKLALEISVALILLVVLRQLQPATTTETRTRMIRTTTTTTTPTTCHSYCCRCSCCSYFFRC